MLSGLFQLYNVIVVSMELCLFSKKSNWRKDQFVSIFIFLQHPAFATKSYSISPCLYSVWLLHNRGSFQCLPLLMHELGAEMPEKYEHNPRKSIRLGVFTRLTSSFLTLETKSYFITAKKYSLANRASYLIVNNAYSSFPLCA